MNTVKSQIEAAGPT